MMKALVQALLLCASSTSAAYAAPSPISSDLHALPRLTKSLSDGNVEAYAAEFSESAAIHFNGDIITKARWISIIQSRLANHDHYKLAGFLAGIDSFTVIEKIIHTCMPRKICEGIPVFEVYQYKLFNGKVIELLSLSATTYVSDNLELEVAEDNLF